MGKSERWLAFAWLPSKYYNSAQADMARAGYSSLDCIKDKVSFLHTYSSSQIPSKGLAKYVLLALKKQLSFTFSK